MNYFNRPYYTNNSLNFRIKQAFGFGAFVFFFLWFFSPFQIDALPQDLFTVALGFGLITLVVMLILNVAIPMVFKKYFNEEHWTLGKEFVWTLVNITLIGLANFLFFTLYCLGKFSWNVLMWFQLVTLVMGSIPVSILLLWKESRDAKKYRSESERINMVKERNEAVTVSDNSEIEIISQNTGESFRLNSDQLVYIQSADNYLEVHYWKNDKFNKIVIRNTLAAMESALGSHPQFFRCHKSYLINMNLVDFVSGNAQGYRLHLKNSGFSVPVSRNYNDFVKMQFAGHP
jgi:hypothetical protein